MEHRDTKTLGRWIALVMMVVLRFTYGQEISLDPIALANQSLSAYSTDFQYGNTVRTYESPNPKKNPIWAEEDMYTINFKEILEKQDKEIPHAFMKVALKGSEIPEGKWKNQFVTVDLFLYDSQKQDGYDEAQKLVQISMNYDSYLNYHKTSDGETSDFIAFVNKKMRGLNNKTYHSNRIKQALWNLDLATKLKNTVKGKVVVRISFSQIGKLVDLKFPGLGQIEPQQLLYAKGQNIFNPPSSNEKIVDFPGTSDIYRWKWEGNSLLYGTKNNILNIAEVDLSQDSDLELKLDYVFKDPRSEPSQFNPKTFRNRDGSPGVLTAEELASRLSMEQVEPIMIDQPQSGMFDVVSNRVARAGALFAVNGAFYDYYYYCLPGVKTSMKIDGKWRYLPDIFNHRNTGALVFDKTEFDFLRNERHDSYIGDELGASYFEAGAAYHEFGGLWPNLMSGGHFSEKGKPYRFYPPKVSEGLDYFWENPKEYYPDMPDTKATAYRNWNKTEFSTWSMIACQKRDDRGKVAGDFQYTKNGEAQVNLHSFSDAFTPAWLDGTRNSFGINGRTLYMNRSTASNLYTAVDYSRYPHEFGIQKRGRTFIAKKGKKLYVMTADGLYAPGCEYGEQTKAQYYAKTAPGLTIDELSDLSQKLEFDALLNLDGGGSSTFFVNGKGMVQSPYAGTAEGPMQQRFLSSTLMVVPKILPTNIKAESAVNRHSLRFDNSRINTDQFETWNIRKCTYPNGRETWEIVPKLPYKDWAPIQALSLTPSLDKFTKTPYVHEAGSIAGSFKTSPDSEGAILFAMSENGQYGLEKDPATQKDIGKPIAETRSLFVMGVGKMPKKLIEILEPLGESIGYDSSKLEWDLVMQSNNQSFYTILVNSENVEYFMFADQNVEDSYKKYTNGGWHSFNFYFEVDEETVDLYRHFFMDGEEVLAPNTYYNPNVGSWGLHLFNAKHVTHAMIGAIPLQGSYVTGPKSDLTVDNFIYLLGHDALFDFFHTAKSNQTDLADTPNLFNVMKKVNEDITYNHHQLPAKYKGFGWNDPSKQQWYLQFEEGRGYHAHAVNDQKQAHFYGLNLWGTWETKNFAEKEVADTIKALDSIVDPIIDQPLGTTNVSQEANSVETPPNSEDASDTAASFNGLADNTLRHSWNVHPNPASSSLFLDLVLEENTPLDIYLFNLSGQELFHARSARMNRGTNRVDLGEITRRFGGKQQLYLLKVRGNGFAPIDTKIMIK